MKELPFIGREIEMESLKRLLSTRSASLIVVRGRRRIGKSRLLSEFGKEIKSFFLLVRLRVVKQQHNCRGMNLRGSFKEQKYLVLVRMIGEICFAISLNMLRKDVF